MVTLIASTVLALTPLQNPPAFGAQTPVGKIKKAAPVSEATKTAQLQNAAGAKKAITWTPLMTLTAARTNGMGGSLVFYRPSCVDGAFGFADLLGMPGGWNSQPGDQQSYLLVRFPVTAGRRYGLVFEIDRYLDDDQHATFTLESPVPTVTKSLNGSGNLYFSFVAPQSGQGGAMLKMTSKGRYLFNKLDVKVANN